MCAEMHIGLAVNVPFFTRTGIFQKILVTFPICHKNPFSGSNATKHTKIYWLRNFI
jgi:hypothetical protein